MKIKAVKEKLFYLVSIGISVFLLFFFITCSWIGYEVKDQCQDAKREQSEDLSSIGKQDCVESLITLLKDENKGFRSRNDAVWALGQLGDGRALSVLRSFYTGKMPTREPLDKSISQYELKKAIKLTSGGFNITAFVWRGILSE